jgi:hypothetical protein
LTTITSASAAARRALNRKHLSKCAQRVRVHTSGSAATSSHTSARGGVGRSATDPSLVRSAHARIVSSSARMPGSNRAAPPAFATSSRARQR